MDDDGLVGADVPVREPSAAELVHLVDDVFAASEDWLALPARLIDLAKASGFDENGPALMAARHGTRMVLRDRREQGRRPEVVLTPLSFPLDGQQATRPRDAPPEAAAIWRRIADEAQHPATRARFLDLLVLRRGPGTPATAAAACRAYLQLRPPARTGSPSSTTRPVTVRRTPRHAPPTRTATTRRSSGSGAARQSSSRSAGR